ncbi:kappa-type opioid receptor-like, partial [Phymastichus coffea]|uniref:kappa-type opioid receptor-like n=1 Tax=Phymastichus coffea TaxID=108790 RepID=UPI00273B63F3
SSPFIFMASFHMEHKKNGTIVPVCLTTVNTLWNILYISSSTVLFFIVPVIILVSSYTVMIYKLSHRLYVKSDINRTSQRDHKRIIRMLCIIILIFFICVLPFRAMMLWIIFSPLSEIIRFSIDGYYSLLYFSRIMCYLNSALNPIIYTFMSTSFRKQI